MPHRVKKPGERGRHFIRPWRLYRGLTQQQVADRIGTTKANISRVETFKQPYTQDFLEAMAEALSTDPASLIMRNPTDPEAPWSLWEQAKIGQRKQALRVLQGGRKKKAS
jgi:transcriptional regulator with XRE-family HTH domain